MIDLTVLKQNPLIAAVKDGHAFEAALNSCVKTIFLLKGDICSVNSIVAKAHDAHKAIFLHVDLLDGFGRDEYALKYIKNEVKPDGIITTKPQLVKIARQIKISAIFRAFVFDNMSFKAALDNINLLKPELMEILPALMPTVIKRLSENSDSPIIAGGLVSAAEEVKNCLKAGAKGVSTSCTSLWNNI